MLLLTIGVWEFRFRWDETDANAFIKSNSLILKYIEHIYTIDIIAIVSFTKVSKIFVSRNEGEF